MLLFTLLLSFTLRYFHYLFSHNIAHDLRDNWDSCSEWSLQVVTNLCIFDEFKANRYILKCCGIKMNYVRMLIFGIHVSADAHWYSRLVNLFLKAHYVIQYFSSSQLFSKIHHNYFFNHFESQFLLKLKAFVHLRWQHICRCSESGSLLCTVYLICIFCITINFYFYLFFNYFLHKYIFTSLLLLPLK